MLVLRPFGRVDHHATLVSFVGLILMAFTDTVISRATAFPHLSAALIPLTSAGLTSSHLLKFLCFGIVLGRHGAVVILWRSCLTTIDIPSSILIGVVQGGMPALGCQMSATCKRSHTACWAEVLFTSFCAAVYYVHIVNGVCI